MRKGLVLFELVGQFITHFTVEMKISTVQNIYLQINLIWKKS